MELKELWNMKPLKKNFPYLDISPAGQRRGFVTTGEKMHDMQKTQTVKFQAKSHKSNLYFTHKKPHIFLIAFEQFKLYVQGIVKHL